MRCCTNIYDVTKISSRRIPNIFRSIANFVGICARNSRRKATTQPRDYAWQQMARAACALLLALTLALASADQQKSCGLGYPISATWRDSPPYVHPDGCRLAVHSRRSLQRCLANRTLYIIGNSIARNYQAEIAELVGGASPFTPNVARVLKQGGPMSITETWKVSSNKQSAEARLAAMRQKLKVRRKEQKKLCGNSCETTCKGGFRIKYARVQYYGRWMKGFPRFGDVCGQSGTNAACLGDFFSDSKEGDVLVFQMGLMYGITHLLDRNVAKQWPMPRLKKRVEADIASFPETVAKVFNGRKSDVYFVTTGPASPGKWTKVNEFVRWFNPVAAAAFGGSSDQLSPSAQGGGSDGSSGAGYKIIDQYGINKPHVASSLYNDYVHISGPLTQALLHILLNDICPPPTD